MLVAARIDPVLDCCNLNPKVLICFSLIAFWFNAMLVPFKLFITVVVPVTWTYGAAFYVYEDGALSWLGIPGAECSLDSEFLHAASNASNWQAFRPRKTMAWRQTQSAKHGEESWCFLCLRIGRSQFLV